MNAADGGGGGGDAACSNVFARLVAHFLIFERLNAFADASSGHATGIGWLSFIGMAVLTVPEAMQEACEPHCTLVPELPVIGR